MSAPQSASAIRSTSPEEAIDLDSAELDALLDLLAGLDEGDWSRPTDCTLWTVRDICAHIVGGTDQVAHPGRSLRNLAVSRRMYPGMSQLDALNQLQVDERAARTGPDLTADLARLVPARLKTRRRFPSWARRIPLPPGLSLPPGATFGYALDVIVIRDVWMHRVDISIATNREVVLDVHDGGIIRQVVADLGRSWTAPAMILQLDGPAGGEWRLGEREPVAVLRVDAVQYMRCLAGRNVHLETFIEGDLAAAKAAIQARVVF